MTRPLHGCTQLQNEPATSKQLISLIKSLTVARLQRFQGGAGRQFKLSGRHPPENRATVQRPEISSETSIRCWLHPWFATACNRASGKRGQSR
jgi:hypothetical protein